VIYPHTPNDGQEAVLFLVLATVTHQYKHCNLTSFKGPLKSKLSFSFLQYLLADLIKWQL